MVVKVERRKIIRTLCSTCGPVVLVLLVVLRRTESRCGHVGMRKQPADLGNVAFDSSGSAGILRVLSGGCASGA